MELFQLEKSLQQKILNQFQLALYRAVVSVNNDFHKFTSFNHYTSHELQSEEKGQITGLLNRAISKRFVEKFNHIGCKTQITIFPLKGKDSFGKDYVIQIKQKSNSKNIELNVEQKINFSQRGKWSGHTHTEKCNMFFLIEIGNVSFNKGINKLWACIFDKTTAKSKWTRLKKRNSGFSHLRLSINDIENIQVLIGDMETTSKHRPRKYIKPIYSKIS